MLHLQVAAPEVVAVETIIAGSSIKINVNLGPDAGMSTIVTICDAHGHGVHNCPCKNNRAREKENHQDKFEENRREKHSDKKH